MPRDFRKGSGIQLLSFLLAVFCSHSLVCALPRHRSNVAISAEHTLEGHTDGIMDLAFFPDSTRLVSAAHDNTVRMWDVATGKTLHVFHGPMMPACSVSVSADSKRIAAGSLDHTAFVWDVATGDLIAVLHGQSSRMRVVFLPDGHLLTGCGDGILRIWDVDQEKELWHSTADAGVSVITVTPDGRRAAFGASDGTVRVWDLVDQRRLASVGEPGGFAVVDLGIRDDGVFVYRSVSHDDTRCWAVDTGKEQPLVKRVATSGLLTRNAEFKWSGRELIDVRASRTICSLNTAFQEMRAIAIAPDHMHVAIGGGGDEHDENETWDKRHDNLIQIFRMPGTAAPATLPIADRRTAGAISWGLVPLELRDPAGVKAQISDLEGIASWPNRKPWKCFSLKVDRGGRKDQPLDVIASSLCVLLQKEPGILDEALVDPNARYSDVVWDDKHLWVATLTGQILVLDCDGRVVEMIDHASGLPPASQSLRLYALSAGKVLAAGGDQSGGWCALLDSTKRLEDGVKTKVNVFFHEQQISKEWSLGGPARKTPLTTFCPISMTEPPGADGRRIVWIFCSAIPRSAAPVLRVNTATLECSSYNLGEGVVTFRPDRPSWLAVRPDTITWLDAHTLLINDYGKLLKAKVGLERMERAEATCLATATDWRPEFLSPLRIGDAYYFPGNDWYRLDLKRFEVRHLGTGVCVAGAPVNGLMTTFVSAHLGLVAFSPEDDCFFRLSFDPTQPLPLIPILAPPKPELFPSDGIFEGTAEFAQLRCGGGELIFSRGKLVPPTPFNRDVHAAVVNKQLEKGVSRFVIDGICSRMFDADERARCGLTDADLARFKKLLDDAEERGRIDIDSARLETMLKSFAPAIGTRRQQEASKPLMVEARKLGERWSSDEDHFLTALRGFFSDRQWKLLLYEDPDLPGEPDTRSTF